MSDIVERLRINSTPMRTLSACDLENAADEIEQLRKDNKQLWSTVKTYADRNGEIHAENEKLRAELHDAEEMLFNQAKTIKELQDKLGIEPNVGD